MFDGDGGVTALVNGFYEFCNALPLISVLLILSYAGFYWIAAVVTGRL